jgi:hypothetical protein
VMLLDFIGFSKTALLGIHVQNETNING